MPDDESSLSALADLLRSHGVSVGTHQVITLAEAANALAPVTATDLYWAGRTILVSYPDDLPTYERVFVDWLASDASDRQGPQAPPGQESLPVDSGAPKAHGHGREGIGGGGVAAAAAPVATSETGGGMSEGEAGPDAPSAASPGAPQEGDEVVGTIASATEALRTRRFDQATDAELSAMRELMANIVVTVPHRRGRRTRRVSRGRVPDLRRSVRSAIQTDGEILRRAWKDRRVEPRRLVLILDVSGSMAGYSRALLQFAFSARVTARKVEVFCFGTRLTRLTDDLGTRDVDTALAAAAARVVDWDGGTLIGESLATLNRTYGRRGLLRGAIVVMCSDGLDRGDPELLGDEMARVARYAHRVVWVNPLKGDDRYEPLARGMAAALPHVDRFLSGHDLASLEHLGNVLSSAR